MVPFVVVIFAFRVQFKCHAIILISFLDGETQHDTQNIFISQKSDKVGIKFINPD